MYSTTTKTKNIRRGQQLTKITEAAATAEKNGEKNRRVGLIHVPLLFDSLLVDVPLYTVHAHSRRGHLVTHHHQPAPGTAIHSAPMLIRPVNAARLRFVEAESRRDHHRHHHQVRLVHAHAQSAVLHNRPKRVAFQEANRRVQRARPNHIGSGNGNSLDDFHLFHANTGHCKRVRSLSEVTPVCRVQSIHK